MKSVAQTILGAVAGIIISLFVFELVNALNAKWYPSAHMNPTIAERLKEIETLPLQALLIILGGYIVSSFMGGYTAARIAPAGKKILAAFCVGFFLLLAGIVYFIALPHPLWLALCSGVSYLLFSYLGGQLANGFKKTS